MIMAATEQEMATGISYFFEGHKKLKEFLFRLNKADLLKSENT